MRTAAALLLACTAMSASAQTKSILFVGNSFTYTRPPALQYNVDNVVDLTYPYYLATPADNDPKLPQPWGGVAGLFEAMTAQAGLDYEVFHSLRGGATLRGHYLNTNPVNWDLRVNLTKVAWDVVVVQGNSTEALPRTAGAELCHFRYYLDKIERYIHVGAAESFRERDTPCGGNNTPRNIAANPNARAATQVYLYQTWARPDLIYRLGQAYSGESLEAMTGDLRAAYLGAAAANGKITGVSLVGDAFLRAVQDGVAMRNPYEPTPGTVDLWWHEDQFHPSKYGAYLSALVHFATITRLNPLMLGPGERGAADLGISPEVAVKLQRVAQSTVELDVTAPTSTATLSFAPNANGWHNAPVVVGLAATDNARGAGVAEIEYSATGAHVATGAVGAAGAVTIASEGVTTFTWFAEDRAGNAEAARSIVLRVDATPPAISLPASFAIDATSPAGAVVTYAAAATDNSGLVPALSCAPASGATLPIGTAAVACSATDVAGNGSTGSFLVTVRGAADQANTLLAAVSGLQGVNFGVVTSLTQQLQRAMAATTPASCAEYEKFEKHAANLPAKVLPAEQAAALAAAAQRIRAAQGC